MRRASLHILLPRREILSTSSVRENGAGQGRLLCSETFFTLNTSKAEIKKAPEFTAMGSYMVSLEGKYFFKTLEVLFP